MPSHLPRALLAALFIVGLIASGAVAAEPVIANSPNLTHIANELYPTQPGDTTTDAQGGTDLELATVVVPEDSVNEETRGQTRDFAFAGTYQNGLQVMDITDPENPVRVATYPCTIDQGDVQVFTQGDRTYVGYGIDGGARTSACLADIGAAPATGTLFIDVTDPYAPRSVSLLRIPNGSHNLTIHPDGQYLYNSPADLVKIGTGTIEVFDISDVTTPTLTTVLNLGPSLDSHDITFNKAGDRAYTAALSETIVIDTTAPEAPVLLGRIVDPTVNIHHQADPFTLEGPAGPRDFVIVNDELAGAAGNGLCPGGGLHVYDVTGPLEMAPVKVGVFLIPDVNVNDGADTGAGGVVTTCTAHVFRVYEEQQLLTIAWFAAGVRVLDLSGLVAGPVGPSAGVVPELGSASIGINEIGYHRFVEDSDTWAAKVHHFEEDGSFFLYGNDQTRGFDVYRFEADAPTASDGMGQWLTPDEARVALGVRDAGTRLPFCAL